MKKGCFLCLGTSVCLTFGAVGATVTWDGDAGDGKWSSPTNWSGDNLPGVNDIVVFPLAALPSDHVVHLDGDYTIRSVNITGSGNDLTIDGDDGQGGLHKLTLSRIGESGTGNGVLRLKCGVVQAANGNWKGNGWTAAVWLCGPVESSGDYTLTFDGAQNSNVAIMDDADLDGTSIVVKNWSFDLGHNTEVTDHGGTVLATGGRLLSAASVELTNNGLGYNPTSEMCLQIYNTLYPLADRFGKDVPLRITGSGAAIKYFGHATESADQHFNDLRLESGRLFLQVESGADANPCTVYIGGYTRSPGATLQYRSNKNGRLRVSGAANEHGMWKPWAFYLQSQTFLKVDETDPGDVPLIVPLADADYVQLASSGNPKDAVINMADVELTLDEDVEAWALRLFNSKTNILHLGTHKLKVASGAMILRPSYLSKIDAASGGALVFGGEDIVLGVRQGDQSGQAEVSAPIEWERPSGSAVQYPSLAFEELRARVVVDGRRGLVLSGEDRIGDYYALATGAAADDNSNSSYLVFAGDSDRTFHGPVTGTVPFRKEGRGVLRFCGDYAGRISAGGNIVAEGTVVFEKSNYPASAVLPGATLLVGSAYANNNLKPAYSSGARVGGLGTVGAATATSGLVLAPGLDGVAGTFKWGGSMTPAGDLAIEFFADEEANGCVQVNGQMSFQEMANNGGTLTLRVTDPHRGAVDYRGREFMVLNWTGTVVSSPASVTVAIENGSPRTLDTSEATWRYDSKAKAVYVSGVKNLRGMVISVR